MIVDPWNVAADIRHWTVMDGEISGSIISHTRLSSIGQLVMLMLMLVFGSCFAPIQVSFSCSTPSSLRVPPVLQVSDASINNRHPLARVNLLSRSEIELCDHVS